MILTSKLRILGIVGVVALLGAVFGAGHYTGTMNERLENEKAFAKMMQIVQEQQAALQAEINTVTDNYHQALKAGEIQNAQVEDYKTMLRREIAEAKAQQCEGQDSSDIVHTGPVKLAAHYRLFNEAADHPELSGAVGSRIPDEAGDGLDAIQACLRERHELALQLNHLINVIKIFPNYHPTNG